MSLERNSECVMEGESGEQVGGEFASVTSSGGCMYKAGGMRQKVDSRDKVMHSEMSDW